MKKILIYAFIQSTIFLFFTHVNASIIEKTSDREYEAQKEEYIKVSEIRTIQIKESNWQVKAGEFEIFTIFLPAEQDSNRDEKETKTLESIKVFDQNGSNLEYITEKKENDLLLKVTVPSNITIDNSLQINLEYHSYGLIVKSGAIYEIYIPAFPEDYTFENNQKTETVNTSIRIPEELGEVNFTSPEYEIVKSGTDSIIKIPQEKLLGTTTWIQVGNMQFFDFSIEQDYPASSNFPLGFNYFKIPLPRDIISGPITQQVYFEDIFPAPYSIEIDEDQNLLAIFQVPANKSGTIKISGFASLHQDSAFELTKENSGDIQDISIEYLEKYTSPAIYWESDNSQIKETSDKINNGSSNIFEIIYNTYNYVVDSIDYDQTKKFGINNERQGALKTLEGGAAVCMEYSDLFIALMKSSGLPARAGYGHGFSAFDPDTENQGFNHQWAEVYVPGIDAWIGVDTTWGENGPALIGGDLNHLYSHVASKDPETPSTVEVTYIGQIGPIPSQQSVVEPLGRIPESSDLLSQSEIINKYPNKSEPRGLENLWEIIKQADRLVIEKMENQIGAKNTTMARIVQFIIVFSLILGIFISRKLILKSRKSNIKHNV